MSKYINLTNDNFDETVKEGVTLVDFFAPWCGPCRMIAPTIEEIAEDFDGRATIAKVNADEEQFLTTKYNVKSIPNILIFKDGEEVDQLVGAASKDALTELIEKYL